MSDIRKLSTGEFILSQVTTDGNNEISLKPGSDGKFTISNTDPGTNVDLEIDGGTTIRGNLQVDGTLTFVDQTDFSIADKIITLNEGETGSGIGSPGMLVWKLTVEHSVLQLYSSRRTVQIVIGI